jgi:acyl-CoA thioesterase FadM
LLWAERLLSNWRREAWMSLTEMLESGLASPVVHTEISYMRPLRLDDEVKGTIWFLGRSTRSFTVLVRFADVRDGRPAAEVRIKQVFVRRVGDDMEPTEIPDDLVAVLEAD